MRNPLIPDILNALRESHAVGATLTAHQLLTAFAQHAAFDQLSQDPQLQLFQKNFLLMNGLYQLQSQLWDEDNLNLEVSVLAIRLVAGNKGGESSRSIHISSPLKTYYLDWNNFSDTTLHDVETMLNDFWNGFLTQDKAQQALQTLGLEQGAKQPVIRRRYRELAAKHHPDKGGSEQQFIEIRQAYEVLIARFA